MEHRWVDDFEEEHCLEQGIRKLRLAGKELSCLLRVARDELLLVSHGKLF